MYLHIITYILLYFVLRVCDHKRMQSRSRRWRMQSGSSIWNRCNHKI